MTDEVKVPAMFWRLLTVMTPVVNEYEVTVPSKVLLGSDCEMTTTELPVI
jgi:hypothetical protein